jgi:hypothetical protein
MIVVSVGLLGITATFNNASSSLTVNEAVQQTAQYAQECAEKVIATRRYSGFTSANINTSLCNTPAMPAGFIRSVNVSSPYSGTGTGTDPCPNGNNNCKNVTITVTSGAQTSSITIMLVDYK